MPCGSRRHASLTATQRCVCRGGRRRGPQIYLQQPSDEAGVARRSGSSFAITTAVARPSVAGAAAAAMAAAGDAQPLLSGLQLTPLPVRQGARVDGADSERALL
jgi:hypothetical protein